MNIDRFICNYLCQPLITHLLLFTTVLDRVELNSLNIEESNQIYEFYFSEYK